MRGHLVGCFMMANASSVSNHSIFKSLSFIFIFFVAMFLVHIILLLFHVHLMVLFLMPFTLNVYIINIFVWMCTTTCVERIYESIISSSVDGFWFSLDDFSGISFSCLLSNNLLSKIHGKKGFVPFSSPLFCSILTQCYYLHILHLHTIQFINGLNNSKSIEEEQCA